MPVALRWFLRLGPMNPIAARLVQNGSRRTKHLYLRLAYLGVLIAVLLWALVINTRADQMSFKELASAGAVSFQAIAYLQIGLICVLAPVFMAGAIAQEADPRTWDILLATPLGATEIVLGNLFGRLFFIIALLAASLPLFAITQYFGGVAGATIMASYAIAACAALVVGSMAVALSVSRIVGKRAVFTFYVAVVSFIAVTWAGDALTGGGARVTYFTAINPFLALRALMDATGYPTVPIEDARGWDRWFLSMPVRTFCTISGVLSLITVVASIVTVRVGGIAGVSGLGTRDANAKATWLRRTLGFGKAGGKGRRVRYVWHNPIAWREAASRNATFGRTAARWGFVGAGILWAFVLMVLLVRGVVLPATFRTLLIFTVMGELASITLVAINTSATSVSREREDGTLDLLLTTPITPAQYLSGKLRGMVYYLLPMLAVPLATMAIAGITVLLGDAGVLGAKAAPLMEVTTRVAGFTPYGVAAGGSGVTTIAVPLVLPEAGLVAAMVCIPFVALCVMVGMSLSLRSKGTLGAVVSTVGVLSVTAGLVGFCAWSSGSQIQVIGSIMAALSPASSTFASVFAEEGLRSTVEKSGLGAARTALMVGAVISAALHLAVIYGIRSAMTRNFDMTVRRLAGAK
ncbi:hypothetical protein BH11PLA1_BH11PLA1_20110 [soil metagenome]